MFYTVYRTTNLINGKFYIGTHKTNDPNDNYLGSGKLLKRAIEKYGVENFKKEVLFIFETAEEMFAKEAELVNEDFLEENNTYNLIIGGYGGFSYINTNVDLVERNRRISSKRSYKEPGMYSERSIKIRKENGYKASDHLSHTAFLGKSHTQKTKDHLSNVMKGKYIGMKSSQFGSRWINNGVENKKIKSDESIPEGWILGRKIK